MPKKKTKSKNKPSEIKAGVEIHQQLDTHNKLFCECRARLSPDEPVRREVRKLRAVVGELGKIDIAAAYEAVKNKEFEYLVYRDESCNVELDEEPPHQMNQEALETGIMIALMLNCEIPDEIQVMRKTVLDGSNTAGFQRTALVGLNGWMETSFGTVGITNVSVEEDACQLIKRGKKRVVYGLDRLGIPLVEIGTTPDITKPEQAKEVAKKLGMILRSTGKVKRGLGTIRQDVNVSVPKGSRVEIKGVQDLKNMPKVVELEAERQRRLISKGKKVPMEVRRAKKNSKTEFMRPLPGSARLYPETDIAPITVSQSQIKSIKMRLPELITEKKDRYIEEFGLSPEIANLLSRSGRTELFEFLAEFADPKIIATTLTSTLKQLKREGVDTEVFTEENFREVFEHLEKGKITKDIIPDVLTRFSKVLLKDSDTKLSKVIKDLGIESMSEKDVRKLIKKTIKKNPKVLKAPRPEKALMGMVMKEVRGNVPGKTVIKLIQKELKKS